MRTDVREPYDTPGRAAIVPYGDAVLDRVLRLVGALRAAGVPVSTGEAIDAATALASVDLGAREQVRAALLGTLVKDADGRTAFDRVFAALFPPGRRAEPPAPPATDRRPDLGDLLAGGDPDGLRAAVEEAVDEHAGIGGRAPASERNHVQRVLRRLDLQALLLQVLAARSADARDELARRLAATESAELLAELRRLVTDEVRRRLAAEPGAPDPVAGVPGHGAPGRPAPDLLPDVPLLRAGPDELAALRAAVRPLGRRLATRLSARRARRSRGALDMRRTVRRSLGTGGVPLEPALRRRGHSRPELVVLCDVSGSMAQFAPFTLALLHAVHAEFGRVRTFAFVDGVAEISDLLAAAPGVVDPRHLLRPGGAVAGDGRSDYGAALRAFAGRYGDAVTARTTVVVAGDGRSHDRDPGVAALRELAARSRRLYWLDPEPRADWSAADCAMPAYATECTDVFEVATLRQLTAAVAAIAPVS